jgi:hypothetical protein
MTLFHIHESLLRKRAAVSCMILVYQIISMIIRKNRVHYRQLHYSRQIKKERKVGRAMASNLLAVEVVSFLAHMLQENTPSRSRLYRQVCMRGCDTNEKVHAFESSIYQL